METEEFEDRLEELGVFVHYSNIISELSNLITYLDNNLDEKEADELISELLDQIKMNI